MRIGISNTPFFKILEVLLVPSMIFPLNCLLQCMSFLLIQFWPFKINSKGKRSSKKLKLLFIVPLRVPVFILHLCTEKACTACVSFPHKSHAFLDIVLASTKVKYTGVFPVNANHSQLSFSHFRGKTISDYTRSCRRWTHHNVHWYVRKGLCRHHDDKSSSEGGRKKEFGQGWNQGERTFRSSRCYGKRPGIFNK